MRNCPPADIMVRLDAVAKTYAGTHALHPINLEVRSGEFLALLGPSGSGKSTLLNIISGMVSPGSGRVTIDGRDVTSVPPAKRGIGMVFQNYALMPHMSIFRNVAFPLEVRGVGRNEIRRRVTEVLALVRLSEVADRKPRELSGGQQQRVSLARCLIYKPSLILMDEPLGALDKSLREQMQLEIKRLHAQSKITIIYVTHDQEEALNMADRIMLINGGAIEQIGSPDELYSSPVSCFAAAFLGESSLIPCMVTAPGTVHLACGPTVRVRTGAAAGSGHLLVRPERLRLAAAGENSTESNRVEGVLRDTLVTGGVIKHFVTLDDGTQLIVQELANERRTNFVAGTQVTATWPQGAALFLDH